MAASLTIFLILFYTNPAQVRSSLSASCRLSPCQRDVHCCKTGYD
jgi:hypothetical protein